jgi:hypothetical protein
MTAPQFLSLLHKGDILILRGGAEPVRIPAHASIRGTDLAQGGSARVQKLVRRLVKISKIRKKK